MNQNFTPEQIIKLCKKEELHEHKITEENLIIQLEASCKSITEGTFEFNIKKLFDFYSTDHLIDTLILRKLNDNIKRIYKDQQANRRIIVHQVKTLLEDDCPMWILRTDVSSFYESIERETLIEKLKSDSMLSYFSLSLIDRFFSHPLLKGSTGLPRGIALSSTLSEIYMRKFDKWIRSVNQIYYYARFVDDIIVFSNKEKILREVNDLIETNLEKGLKKNLGKTVIFDGTKPSNDGLEYLGYRFIFQAKTNKSKTIRISIAEQKVKKIKSRIVLSLKDFLINSDFALLEDRMKFLTGNYSIRSSIDGHDLKAGIYYNYCYANDIKIFENLNSFYYKLLFSKCSPFGIELAKKINKVQKLVLKKYSYKHGFQNKVFHSFTAKRMKTIKQCWR